MSRAGKDLANSAGGGRFAKPARRLSERRSGAQASQDSARRLSERRSGAEASQDSGFTLLELLAVLALAGMLIALVPPLLGKGSDHARLDHDRHAILDCLRQARGDAIVSGRTVAFRVDPAHRLYGVGKADRSLEGGVELAVESPLAHPGEIRFFADGSASGGLVELTNPAGRERLQIDWLTGKAAPIR